MPRITRAQQRNDIVLAVVLLLGGLLSAVLSSVSGLYGDKQASLALAVGYVFVLAAPIALRRRWPSVVAVIVSFAYFLAVTLRIPEIYAGNIAMFIALYTVGAWETSRRRATIVRVAIIVGMFAWLFVVMFQDATQPVEGITGGAFSRAGAFSPFVAYQLLMIGINALFFGGAYYFGDRSHQQMRERAALEERTAELETEREVTAAQAVALDRVRIARELHDVVAHHVSLMGVQAGVARSLLTRDPDAARETLASVESSARASLHELRQLLETLRTPDGDAAPQTAPTTHGLTSIQALVDDAHRRGAPLDLHRRGRSRVRSPSPRAGEPVPHRAGGADERAPPRGAGCQRRRAPEVRDGCRRARDLEHRTPRFVDAGARTARHARARGRLGRDDRDRAALARRLPRARARAPHAGGGGTCLRCACCWSTTTP
ncbi:signal transduction histidine kinase [Microbacterium sp. SORGH_AS454]|nr:histidine kinase dimerization/phosphoacceptor domain-containing protein [Microbacterium sp. SORGH_AS_0454]MDR6097428.1 signal transduction histidine kinase [Microbacterium sp. SORGH_AS_0454]